MKTLVVAEQLRRSVPGGIGTYIRGLLQGMQAEDRTELTLWASKAAGSDSLGQFDLPVVTSRLVSKLLTRAWDMNKVAPPAGFDVVHATSLSVPPRSSAPMTTMVHDLGWRSFPDAYPKRGRDWHEAALGRAIERSTKLVTPSNGTAKDLIAMGVDAGLVEVIPLGCDHLPEPDERAALTKLHKAGVDGDFILAVGTLEPRKNLGRLIAAFERAKKDLPSPISLVLVGPSGWGEQVKPTPDVHLITSATMPEITALYDECKLFVSVPLLEGFGLPVVEAMSRGAAVVASPVPSAGNATYQVDPMNVAGIAEGIARVLNDSALRYKLIDLGSDHAASLTWAKCARLHQSLWESLA